MFQRSIQLPEKRSFFLFGARSTGKSTLIHQRLPPESTWFVEYLADERGEVDLVIERPGRPVAVVEIKSTKEVREDKLKSLRSLGAAVVGAELYCLSRDPSPQQIGPVLAMPWQTGLLEL